MTTLGWIVAVTVLGGLLSAIGAALVAWKATASQVPVLISYAVGALLGAVFIEILPHAFELSGNAHTTAATILGGVLLFFVLEKLVLWRHCHLEQCEAHEPVVTHDHGRSGLMIVIGDTFHNFVDGIIVAAAFLVDTELGIVTAVAIVAHEIPQEVGDFLVLLNSGYTKRQSLALNVLSSAAMVLGGVISYFALKSSESWTPTLLALAAASMLYVSVADLIPGLHKRPELKETAQQVVLIALGIATIWITGELAHSFA